MNRQPHDEVGGGEQRRPGDGAGQQRRARPVADQRPHEMRYHQPDEADAAGDGNPRADGETGTDDDATAQADDIDAEALRHLVAKSECVEVPGMAQDQRASQQQRRQRHRDMHEAAVGEAAEQPEQHIVKRIG